MILKHANRNFFPIRKTSCSVTSTFLFGQVCLLLVSSRPVATMEKKSANTLDINSHERWKFLAEALLRSLGPAALYFIPWIKFWTLPEPKETSSESTRNIEFQFDSLTNDESSALRAAAEALEVEKAVLQQRLAKAESDLAALLKWKLEVFKN